MFSSQAKQTFTRRLNLHIYLQSENKNMPIQPLEIWLLLHTEILQVYWNSTYTKYTQNNPDNRIKTKNLYILNESSDQINLQKQSRKYLYNSQCLQALKNSIAKLFAFVTVAILIPYSLFLSKNPVATGKDFRNIEY